MMPTIYLQVPVITDRNPHLEGLLDQRRAVYLPYTENKNVLMELPNSPGLFFTSQRFLLDIVYKSFLEYLGDEVK